MNPLTQALLGPDRPIKNTRSRLRARRRPSYKWQLHAAALGAIAAAPIALSLYHLSGAPAGAWGIFAGTLLLANFGEYWLHRIPFHNPRYPDFTYYEHTGIHHAFFSYRRMAMDEMSDLRWVMFAPWVEMLMIAGLMPLFLTLHHFAGAAYGWAFLLGAMVYYSVYEITHAMAHLPESSALGRSRIVRGLSHHHRVHHDPRLMRRYNFSFAIPIFDYVFGTKYPHAQYVARASEPAGRIFSTDLSGRNRVRAQAR